MHIHRPAAEPRDDTTARLRELGFTDQDIAGLWKWLHGKARGIAGFLGFERGSQEEAELSQVAAVELVQCVANFDPAMVPPGGSAVGLLRGYATQFIRPELIREAKRIRNGGTYHSRDESMYPPVKVEGLPVRQSEDGLTEVAIVDYRGEEPEDRPAIDLTRLLAALSPVERKVITLRHGLAGDEPLTEDETAQAVRLTREQVEEVEADALDAMYQAGFDGAGFGVAEEREAA